MRTRTEIIKRLKPYIGYELLYHDWGYIAWQMGTGENVEILFLEVKEPRKGYGRALVQEMKKRITPYHSVYVFRRAINEDAGKFYRALGFTETLVKGLYRNEDSVLGVIAYKDL